MRHLRTVLAWAAGLAGLIVAVPLALAILPFWLVGAVTRGLAGRAARRATPWHDLIVFDPQLGWRLVPGASCSVEEDPFRVTTDERGFRGRSTTLEEADVVVFGDSYAFGHAVDDRHFFAEVSDDPKIKAVGAPGYSMVQGLLWMRRLGEELRGKLCVWMVYLGNDLDDNLRPHMSRYRAPFVRERRDGAGWEVVGEHLDPAPWPIQKKRTNYENFVEICRPTYLSDRALSACEFLIEEGDRACREVGASLAVVTIPDLSPLVTRQFEAALEEKRDPETFDPELPDRRMAAVCERLGIPFVPLRTHLDGADYLLTDCHWTPRGHRRVAAVIRRLHRERNSPSRRPVEAPSARSGAVRVAAGQT